MFDKGIFKKVTNDGPVKNGENGVLHWYFKHKRVYTDGTRKYKRTSTMFFFLVSRYFKTYVSIYIYT